MANVHSFKLVSGEEIVGELEPQAINSTKVAITMPLAMQQFPDGTSGFGDFMVSANPERIKIDEAHIMIQHAASDACVEQYTAIMAEITKAKAGTPELILPEQKIIVD